MIDRLYGGTTATCTLCSACGYKSERLEVFNDVSVHVQSLANLEASLTVYTETETMDGDNKYHCSGCDSKVKADRGTRFRDLPPILTFALNRYGRTTVSYIHLRFL